MIYAVAHKCNQHIALQQRANNLTNNPLIKKHGFMTNKQETLKLIKPEKLSTVKQLSNQQLTVLTCYQADGNNFFLLELILKSAAKKFKDQIAFFSCPIRQNKELKQLEIDVKKFPVTLFLKNEQVQDRFWGILPRHKIITKIETQLKKTA